MESSKIDSGWKRIFLFSLNLMLVCTLYDLWTKKALQLAGGRIYKKIALMSVSVFASSIQQTSNLQLACSCLRLLTLLFYLGQISLCWQNVSRLFVWCFWNVIIEILTYGLEMMWFIIST
jgi:hypothetical protein